MSDLPLKATLKAGRDFDAPWLTVDGISPDDLKMKLQAIAEQGVLEALVEAATTLRAIHNLSNGGVLPQPEAAPQAPAQQAPQQSGGWGGQAPQQQAAPPQQNQGGGSRFGGPPHPEGKSCEFQGCGKVLEFKKTASGKGTWRCPDWRWGNGNPNGHTQEWAN